MKTTISSVVLSAIISLSSCKDAGTIPQSSQEKSTDCGSFELFTPKDSTGDYYYITGVRVFPIDKEVQNGITNHFYCRTLRGQLAFSIHTEYKRLTSDELKNMPGLTTDPKVGEIVNPIKWVNASMRFDRPIYFRGQEVPAAANLLGRIPIIVPSFYFPLTISPFVWDEIHMSVIDFSLPNGNYKVLVSWETSDSKTIGDTVDVAIALH